MRTRVNNKGQKEVTLLGIFILLTMSFPHAECQPLENEFPATYIDFSFGYSIPVTTLEKGEITDQLIGYRSRYNYIRYLSATRFFNEWIGLNVHFQSCDEMEPPGLDPSLYRYLTEQYDAQYYFTATELPPGSSNTYGRDFSQWSLGIVYRISGERFFILPQLNYGYTGFSATNVEVLLKEKNSNIYQTIEYKHDKYKDGYFTAGLGARIGWRVFNRIFLKAECGYNLFRPDFYYTITERNLAEQTSTTRLIDYAQSVHTLTFGFGLSYEFDYKQTGIY